LEHALQPAPHRPLVHREPRRLVRRLGVPRHRWPVQLRRAAAPHVRNQRAGSARSGPRCNAPLPE
jgi:hypothetical protein